MNRTGRIAEHGEVVVKLEDLRMALPILAGWAFAQGGPDWTPLWIARLDAAADTEEGTR